MVYSLQSDAFILCFSGLKVKMYLGRFFKYGSHLTICDSLKEELVKLWGGGGGISDSPSSCFDFNLSYDVASGSEIMPCNKINKPLESINH